MWQRFNHTLSVLQQLFHHNCANIVQIPTAILATGQYATPAFDPCNWAVLVKSYMCVHA